MSSSDMDTNTIQSWNKASDFINRYFPIFIYVFGITGNFLNVIVLSQKPIRSNTSAMFFLVSSISSLIAIVSGLTSRMMAGYAADLTNTVEWICRMRNFILYTMRTITLWLIALATIDRWLSTSADANRRQLSSLKNVRRSIIFTHLFAFILNSPIFYCYQANLTGNLRGCYGSTYICRVITDAIYAVGTTIFPLFLMISFGFMTIKNIRHTQNRIQNLAMNSLSIEAPKTLSPVNRDQHTKRMNRHLLKMLAVQVILFVILTCPHAIQKAYTSISASSSTQSIESAIETFIFNLVTLMNFTASGIPFYIYTLTGGSVFRNALFQLIKRIGLKIFCR